jgi:hypothetical protein
LAASPPAKTPDFVVANVLGSSTKVPWVVISRPVLSYTSGRIANTSRYTTTQTLGATDHIVFCDTDGAVWTLTLPAGVEGTHYKIINCGSSGNDLTVDPDGTEQLYGGGAGVAQTLSDGEVINIHYNATEGWW